MPSWRGAGRPPLTPVRVLSRAPDTGQNVPPQTVFGPARTTQQPGRAREGSAAAAPASAAANVRTRPVCGPRRTSGPRRGAGCATRPCRRRPGPAQAGPARRAAGPGSGHRPPPAARAGPRAALRRRLCPPAGPGGPGPPPAPAHVGQVPPGRRRGRPRLLPGRGGVPGTEAGGGGSPGRGGWWCGSGPGPRGRAGGAERTPAGAAPDQGRAPHRDRCLRKSRCRSSGPAGTCSRLGAPWRRRRRARLPPALPAASWV